MFGLDFNWALVTLVGIAVATLSVLVKLIGFPDQFRKNRARKSTEGLSFWFMALSFASYALWMVYGWLRGDWVVFLAQGALGVVVTGAILWQFFLYRKDGDV